MQFPIPNIAKPIPQPHRLTLTPNFMQFPQALNPQPGPQPTPQHRVHPELHLLPAKNPLVLLQRA